LADRWIRYWPNPYGRGRWHTFLHERVAAHEVTQRMATAQAREELRLVYVAWTRARDCVVLVSRDTESLVKMLPVLEGPDGLLIDEPPRDVAEWVGHQVSLTVRELQPSPPLELDPRGGSAYEAAGPHEHPPASMLPSSVDEEGGAGESERLGDRIEVAGTPEWRTVGELFHGFFAADRAMMPPLERQVLAQSLIDRWGLAESLRPEQLTAANDRLRAWIDTRWPDAEPHREWPLLHRLETGPTVRGSADLVLELTDTFILIDHKTFPGSVEQAHAEAANYAGQLRTYAEAIETATGKTLAAAFIHLPVSGVAIPVSWE